MNFNVGDKVVKESDLGFLFNPYHKERYRNNLIQTVLEANDDVFVINNEKGRYNSIIENGYSCGMNNYLLYSQKDGIQHNYPSPNKLLHLKRDKEYITNKIKDIGKTRFDIDDKILTKEIRRCEIERKEIKETYLEDLEYNLNLIRSEDD